MNPDTTVETATQRPSDPETTTASARAAELISPPAFENAAVFLAALNPYGEVHELRVPRLALSYFNAPEVGARDALSLSGANTKREKRSGGVYVTLNPINPARPDQVGVPLNGGPGASRSSARDADVIRRRNLLIDVDPVRPPDVSATDEELEWALEVRDAIRADLADAGWPEPVAVTMSGNGGGLIYRIDLPNDADSTQLVSAVLKAIAETHGTDRVKIDTSVSNAGRLTKIPGTLACKGENTPERPWRTATAETNPDAGVVSGEQLDVLAGSAESGSMETDHDVEDIRAALQAMDIGWKEELKGGTLKLHLDRCPTGDHAKTSVSDSTILVQKAGRRAYKCQHDTCAGKSWQDLKRILGLDTAGDADVSQAEILLQLAATADLFHTPEGTRYAAFEVNGHRECWSVTAKGFRLWLTRAYYERFHKPPSSQALQSAIGVLESRAQFDGATVPIFTRIGEHEGRIYLDLANDAWEVVKIDDQGWRITTSPPIYFRRPRGMLPLPNPVIGGSVNKLRAFLNVENDESFTLIVAWLLGAMRPHGPYPVLGLHGEPGAAKSTTARMLRDLVDPNAAGIRSMPRTEDDLVIGAVNGWMPIFDNLSYISEWISDALCRIATGGGYSKRELYSDLDETIVEVMRPVVLTGIGNLAAKPDLLDRSILIDLPIIDDDARLEEDDLWPAFDDARPAILGALLDGVSAALREKDSVTLRAKPRMADFARWVVAAESTLGWEPGRFMQAYRANRSRAVQQSLEVSPLVPALEALMKEKGGTWEGSPSELLQALTTITPEQTVRQKNWPKAAHVLGTRLRELAGSLRKVGYEVEFGKSGSRSITIRHLPAEPRAEQAPNGSPTSPNRPGGRPGGGDGPVQPSSASKRAFGGARDSVDDFMPPWPSDDA